jgi:tetratricopeptide (TPR) repeat protein
MKQLQRLKWLILAGILAAFGAFASCAPSDDERDEGSPKKGRITEITQPGDALSEELMLALSMAKNLHHKADVYLREMKSDEAVAALKQILAIRFPEGAPEREDVTLDARARLAKLLASQGKLDEALTTTDDGIKTATRRSFFLANLHAVRGEILEGRALQIENSQPDQAKKLRHDAIQSLDEAIQIENQLLDQRYQERKR